MKIKNLRMTCEMCPSQWSAKTEDDREVYVRYRWGWLTVDLDGPLGENIHDEAVGGEYDGVMDTQTMLRLTGMEHVADS